MGRRLFECQAIVSTNSARSGWTLPVRLLLRCGDVVPLPPKALDVLVVLVDKRGMLVSRDELVSAVWPDTFVEESNLGHHISILRKTLGNVDNGQPFRSTREEREQEDYRHWEARPQMLGARVR